MTAPSIDTLRWSLNEHLLEQLRGARRLRDAYVALDPDGGEPPAIADAFPELQTATPPAPAPTRPVRAKPLPKPEAVSPRSPRAAQTAAGGQRASSERGRETRRQLVDLLAGADEPLTSKQLQERLGLSQGVVDRHLRSLLDAGEILVAEERAGNLPNTYAVPAPGPDRATGGGPPEQPASNGSETSRAPLTPPASALPSAGAGVSGRVRRELERTEPVMPAADVDDNPLRPAGEALVAKIMDCLEQEAAKPSELARQLFLPPPEVAQAFRVAETRGWIERTQDGRYRPTGARAGARGAA